MSKFLNTLKALSIWNERIDELEKYNLDLANESFHKDKRIAELESKCEKQARCNKELDKTNNELEKERDELLVRVTNCEQVFSDAPDLEFSRFKEMFPDEFEAHNLEQHLHAIDCFADQCLTGEALELPINYCENLRNQAKTLRGE